MNTLPTKSENPKGLHKRYHIMKFAPTETDSLNLEPVAKNAEYFVLRLDKNGSDPKHIAACRKAVIVYANEIKEHLPELSKDLIVRYGD